MLTISEYTMAPTKSPKRASFSLPASPFTKDQIPWVIFKFGELKNIKKVQRSFRLEFCPSRPKDVPNYMAFKRLVERFEKSGGQSRPMCPPGRAPTSQEDITAVKGFFMANKKAHLAEASRTLDMAKGKIWYILRRILKWKAYKPHVSHILSQANMKARLECADWFLTKNRDFFSKKVVWGDEKYFVLKSSPNSQNDRFWSPVNPFDNVACKEQGMAKAMCWVGMVDGEIIGPIWVEGSMDQYVYQEMLEDHVLPAISNKRGLWFMQDGATCHTSNMNLEFLRGHFKNRLISNKTDIRWPPKSPDCNPLDFFFWGQAMAHVFRCQPSTMEALKELVGDFAENMDRELVRKVCGSTRDRFEMVKSVGGSYFEHKRAQL